MNFPCHPTRKYCLITAWKVSKYGVFSSPYFPAFGLDTERYGVSLRIKSECGKIRSRKIPYLDTFHAVKKHTHHFNSLKITFHNITKVIMTYFHISVVVNDVEVISQKVPPLACSVSFENVLKNREKIFLADNSTENKISRNFFFIWNEIFHSLNEYETSRYFNASYNISFGTQ